MANLFVIGNGFDLAHGLKSNYFSFRDYIKTENPHLYAILSLYCYDDIWCDLEAGLGRISMSDIIENLQYLNPLNSGSLFNNAQDESTASQIATELESIVNELSITLPEELHKWISRIDETDCKPVFSPFGIEDNFVNFNYTSTLERVYSISPFNIFHIHNKASDDTYNYHYSLYDKDHCSSCGAERRIIFGHNNTSPDFTIPQPKIRSTTLDHDSNNSHETLRGAFEEAFLYYKKSLKPTNDILPVLNEFLETVGPIEKLTIIGHSLSDVDMCYFREITQHPACGKKVAITYYGEENFNETRYRANQFLVDSDFAEFIDLSISKL